MSDQLSFHEKNSLLSDFPLDDLLIIAALIQSNKSVSDYQFAILKNSDKRVNRAKTKFMNFICDNEKEEIEKEEEAVQAKGHMETQSEVNSKLLLPSLAIKKPKIQHDVSMHSLSLFVLAIQSLVILMLYFCRIFQCFNQILLISVAFHY